MIREKTDYIRHGVACTAVVKFQTYICLSINLSVCYVAFLVIRGEYSIYIQNNTCTVFCVEEKGACLSRYFI